MSVDARETRAQMALARHECPNCGEPLQHFSGLESVPEYDYCPCCVDWAYSDQKQLFRLE